MKRLLSIIIAAVLTAGLLAACGSGERSGHDPQNTDKLNIVVTIFPIYDWTMQILGESADDAEVSLLLDNGVDMHSYQPSVEDIAKISTSDLFVYVGGESDEWVDEILRQAKNPDLTVINLLDILGDFLEEEEHIEGMQEVRGEHEEHEEHEAHEEEEEPEYDEHVWLSLRNAQLLCSAIAKQLTVLDPDKASQYRTNLDNYCEQLKGLDEAYKTMKEQAAFKTLVFADRFPFLYLLKDYDIEYYAAFAGCAAEAEASFETIIFLVSKVNELSLPAVMTIDGSDQKLAETVAATTETKDQKILVLDSLQSVTRKELQEGISYLSVMEENLSVLETALNGGQ